MNGVSFTKRQRKRVKHRLHAEANQVAILKGMAREMSPTQAIVFMSYFNQFPELCQPGNSNYFYPAWATTIAQVGIKRRAFWKMTRELVTLGFLQRRVRRLHVEYRIMFDKLDKYLKGTT